MARYKGIYISDLGKDFLTIINVNLVNGVDLLNSRGQSEPTSIDFDRQYIPEVFWKYVTYPKSRFNDCFPYREIIKRYAKLYLNQSTYLKVELPFTVGYDFDNFFLHSFWGNIPDVVTIGYEGEFCNNFYTNLLA